MKTATQKAIDSVVNRREAPSSAVIVEVLDEIDSGKATKEQLAGLVVALSMLARK